MGAGGHSAEAARFRMAPLAAAIEVVELDSWVISAPVGADKIYAFGVAPPRTSPAFIRARALSDAGVVGLRNPRQADGSYQWIARKLAIPAALRDALFDTRSDAWAAGPADLAVLAALKAAANEGRVCPTNRELAAAFGLDPGSGPGQGAEAARWIVRKLVRAGLILMAHRGTRARRVATDPETGNCTPEGRL